MLDPAGRDVIGCVYIYPLPDSDYDACALSWVRESHARLDTPLWRTVSEWLESDWPSGVARAGAYCGSLDRQRQEGLREAGPRPAWQFVRPFTLSSCAWAVRGRAL